MNNETTSFGSCLKTIIEMADLKISALAEYLSYDVSYVSKWIHDKKLPSTKNIEQICSEIAEFLVENTQDRNLSSLLDYLMMDPQTMDYSQLFLAVKQTLENCYFHNKKRLDSVDFLGKKEELTKTYLFPKNVAKNVLMELNPDNFNNIKSIYLLTNMFNVDFKSTYLFLLTLLERHPKRQSIELKYVFSSQLLRAEKYPEKYTPLLLHFLTFTECTNVYLAPKNLSFHISIIKDIVSVVSYSLTVQDCLSLTVFRGKDELDQLYNFSTAYIDNYTKPAFSAISCHSFIEGTDYIACLLSQTINLLLVYPNELFVPKNVFEYLIEQYFPEALHNQLLKIHQLMQHLFLHSDIRLLISKESLLKFAVSRKLSFFNKSVELDFNASQAYLSNMMDMLSSCSTLQSCFFEVDKEDSFYSLRMASLYLTDQYQVVSPHPDNGNSCYYIAQDASVKMLLTNYFENAWAYGKENSSEEVLSYLQSLCQSCSILSFDVTN